jgi:hypothetical protein
MTVRIPVTIIERDISVSTCDMLDEEGTLPQSFIHSIMESHVLKPREESCFASDS